MLLGNLAGYLSEATCKKVLLNAFTRATKDGFPPSRVAGIKVCTFMASRKIAGVVSLLPGVACYLRVVICWQVLHEHEWGDVLAVVAFSRKGGCRHLREVTEQPAGAPGLDFWRPCSSCRPIPSCIEIAHLCRIVSEAYQASSRHAPYGCRPSQQLPSTTVPRMPLSVSYPLWGPYAQIQCMKCVTQP